MFFEGKLGDKNNEGVFLLNDLKERCFLLICKPWSISQPRIAIGTKRSQVESADGFFCPSLGFSLTRLPDGCGEEEE